MSAALIALQTDATAKLAAEPYFATINVLSVRKLQIQSEIDQSLAVLTAKGGKQGVSVLVGMPTVIVDKANPPVLAVSIGLRVMENPTINMDAGSGTLLPAEDVAVQVLQTLHGFQMDGLCMLYADQNAIQPNTELPGVVVYDVLFKATLPLTALTKTALPTMVNQGVNTFSFTGIPAGATVYWTSDGSLPASGNANATAYAGGNVVQGGTIRWAAWKAGEIGSDVGEAVVS